MIRNPRLARFSSPPINDNLVVFLIVLVNFLIRLLPLDDYPAKKTILVFSDYNTNIQPILYFLQTGKFADVWDLMIYPQLPQQIVAYTLLAAQGIAGWFGGNIPNSDEAVMYFYRWMTAILGTGTVILAMRFTGDFWKNKHLTWLVGILYSTALAHIFLSKEIRNDTVAVFFMMGALYGSHNILKTNELKHYIVSGIFLGLAVASRMGTVLILAPLIIAALTANGPRFLWFEKDAIRRYLSMAVTSAVSFFLGNWNQVIHYNIWLKNNTIIRGNFADSIPFMSSGGDGYASIFWVMDYLFSSGLWYPLFFASCAGFLLFCRTEIHSLQEKIYFLSFPVIYLGILALNPNHAGRYTLPLIPWAVIFGALFLKDLLHKKTHPGFKWAMVFIFILLPLGRVIAFDITLAQTSTRSQAVRWIRENVAKGDRVVLSGLNHWEGEEWKNLQRDYTLVPVSLPDTTFESMRQQGFQYILLGENDFQRWYQNIKDRTQDNPNMVPHHLYYKNFWLDMEKNTELVQTFTHPLYEMGIFAPRKLGPGSYLDEIYQPALKILKIVDEAETRPESLPPPGIETRADDTAPI
ncbi:MAG: ArnT family glycosyltransferase [Nitrospinales bacterium]